jgi:DNA polymerase I-like protein with 3'-5' exonuclease and polymerase domains
MFGFKRFFTLENQICRVLFDLANDPPKEWKSEKTALVRRDRNQTTVGATRSALFGAAFNIMSANIRAALNHKIQSTGATPTKNLQRRLWELQPEGEHPWLVRNMQVHDELLNVSTEEMLPEIRLKIKDFLEHYRRYIPLLNITWLDRMTSWSNTH